MEVRPVASVKAAPLADSRLDIWREDLLKLSAIAQLKVVRYKKDQTNLCSFFTDGYILPADVML